MKITLNKRTGLLTLLLPCALALSTTVHVEINKLVVESGDNARSRQYAATERGQWNDTCNLRQKVNKCIEKEWNKTDAVFDNRDKCEQSANTSVYWEPNTLHYLNRRTGHVIVP